MRIVLAVLAGLALGLGGATVVVSADEQPEVTSVAPTTTAPMLSVQDPPRDVQWLDVRRADDDGKPGRARSVMGQLFFDQEPRTSGPSPNSLRFRFDTPVELTGVMVSVDISGPSLVEVVAGVNVEAPYGMAVASDGRHQPFTGRDWLIHTSDSNGGKPSKIDESVTFADPFVMEAGDWVTVDTWVGNEQTTPTTVSPEVILFYRWAG